VSSSHALAYFFGPQAETRELTGPAEGSQLCSTTPRYPMAFPLNAQAPLEGRPTILYWNAGGFTPSKQTQFYKVLHEQKADIFCVSEAASCAEKTDKNLKRLSTPNYKIHILERSRPNSSGLIVGVKSSLVSTYYETHKMIVDGDEIEIATLDVWIGKTMTTVHMLYNPPDNSPKALDNIRITDSTILIGDFNAPHKDWGYKETNSVGRDVAEFAYSQALIVMEDDDETNRTTFLSYTDKTSRPDLILAQAQIAPTLTAKNLECPTGKGHKIIKLSPSQREKTNEPPYCRWNFKKAKWQEYEAELEQKAETTTLTGNPHRDTKTFEDLLNAAAKKFIPRGALKDYKPFWSQRLENLRVERNKWRKLVEQNRDPEDGRKLNRAQEALDKAITEEKEEKYRNFLKTMDYRKDAVKAHTFFSGLCGKNARPTEENAPINYRGKIATTNLEKANALCKHFKSISTPQGHIQAKLPKITYVDEPDDCYNKIFNTEELEYAISRLDNKKAPGPDKIHTEFLKHLGPKAKKLLLAVINSSWTKEIPSSWKDALITALLKPDKDATLAESYRPIALTSALAKTAEKMVNLRLYTYLESNNIIEPEQAGFRQNRGTIEQAAYVAQMVRDGFPKDESTLIVSIDLTGAFDSVDRNRAIKQMIKYKVPNNIVRWLQDFINDRRIKVVHKGKSSRQLSTRCGVAQGTVTAPPTFVVAVNPLITLLKRIKQLVVKAFADDFLLCITSKCPANTEQIMNFVMRIAVSWLKINGFKINPSKTTYTYFTKSTKPYDFKIYCNEEQIKEAAVLKFLGVLFDKKMTGRAHFEKSGEKGSKRLRLLQRAAGVSWGAKLDTLAMTYRNYIRPAMEYGTEIFPNASADQQEKVDKIQNQALRMITGGIKTCPIDAMEWYAQIEPLQLRRQQRAIQLHEKLARLDPVYWNSRGTSKKKAHRNFTENVNEIKAEFCPELLDANRLPFSVPVPSALPTQKNKILPGLTIPQIDKKTNHTKKELKKLTEEHIKKHFPLQEWVHIFTDGSYDSTTKQAGYGIYCLLFEEASPMSLNASAFDAEVAAIAHAAKKIADSQDLPLQKTKFVIFCDSISAIQYITQAANMHSDSLLFKKSLECIKEQNRQLELQWIPSHCDLLGNDKADLLAKKGTKMPPLPNGSMSFNTVKKKIKSAMKKIFAAQIEATAKQKTWWDEIRKGPDKNWTRKTATAQFRLATGHDCLQKHLNRFNITKDEAKCRLCNTGEAQDRAHLFSCAALKVERDALPDDLSRTEIEALLYWIARKKNS
jgi:ribonuclease HI